MRRRATLFTESRASVTEAEVTYSRSALAAVIVFPLFSDEVHDRQAAEVLGEAYPDREIVGVACHEMFLGGGNIHCATQQQPAVG